MDAYSTFATGFSLGQTALETDEVRDRSSVVGKKDALFPADASTLLGILIIVRRY
jgi:hypothetical protein